jgi:hypothetical protein
MKDFHLLPPAGFNRRFRLAPSFFPSDISFIPGGLALYLDFYLPNG